MTANGILQIALFTIAVLAVSQPLGRYMTAVFASKRTTLLERGLYRLSGIREDSEQTWIAYGASMLLFSLAGAVSLYAIMRLQDVLPFNPQKFPAVAPDLALNTAISFITNTNWQAYSGESTMSYLTQMAGLTVHNFLSAATGIALALALIRGFFAPVGKHGRQFLGRYDALHAVRAVADLHFLRAVSRLAGRAANLGCLCRCDHAGRRQADHRAGAYRQSGSDQDAGHEWRRFFQR